MIFTSLERLEALVALATTGSFSRAAQHLHLTQPALSHRIRKLEEECQAPLVIRDTPATLTPQGEILLEHAQRILDLLLDAHVAVQGHRNEARPIRVAASSAWGHSLLPRAIALLHRRGSNVQVELVQIGNTQQLLAAVLNTTADLALGLTDADVLDPSLHFVSFFLDEWYCVCSPLNDDAATERDVTNAFFSNKCVLLRERGSTSRRILDDLLLSGAIHPQRIVTVTGTEAVKKAVKENIGVSLLAGAAISQELREANLHAHRLRGTTMTFTYYAALPKASTRSPHLRDLLRLLGSLGYTPPLDDHAEDSKYEAVRE